MCKIVAPLSRKDAEMESPYECLPQEESSQKNKLSAKIKLLQNDKEELIKEKDQLASKLKNTVASLKDSIKQNQKLSGKLEILNEKVESFAVRDKQLETENKLLRLQLERLAKENEELKSSRLNKKFGFFNLENKAKNLGDVRANKSLKQDMPQHKTVELSPGFFNKHGAQIKTFQDAFHANAKDLQEWNDKVRSIVDNLDIKVFS